MPTGAPKDYTDQSRKDRETINRAKLAQQRLTLILTVIIALTPVAGSFLILYGDIRVIENKVLENTKAVSGIITYVRDRDPIPGQEMRDMMRELLDEVRRNRDLELGCPEK